MYNRNVIQPLARIEIDYRINYYHTLIYEPAQGTILCQHQAQYLHVFSTVKLRNINHVIVKGNVTWHAH